MDGPIHKRAPVAEEGFFHGIQWPAVLVRRKSDMKIMNVSRKKIRVFEKAYLCELDQRTQHIGDVQPDLGEVVDCQAESIAAEKEAGKWESSGGEDFTPGKRPELDKNMVQSIKSLREHRFELPGKRPKATTTIEESAMRMSDQGGEGDYVDETLSANSLDHFTELLSKAKEAAEGIPKLSMRDTILDKLGALTDEMKGGVKKGQLKVGKKKLKKTISSDNIIHGKRKVAKTNKKTHKHTQLKRGDRVSLPSTAFDGNVPGSYSKSHPERCYGHVLKVETKDLVTVKWEEGEGGDRVRMKDLRLESRKASVYAIIMMLSDSSQLSVDAEAASSDKSNWPNRLLRSFGSERLACVGRSLEEGTHRMGRQRSCVCRRDQRRAAKREGCPAWRIVHCEKRWEIQIPTVPYG
jgi:hypothetical protein